MMPLPRPAAATIAWLLLLPLSSQALQSIDASRPEAQGQRFEVNISKREITRIAFDPATPGKIVDVLFNDDELVVDKDLANGQVFIRPNVRASVDGAIKPINVFLVTSNGNTHSLMMQVRDIPLETILIKDYIGPKASDHPAAKALPHEAEILRLVNAMTRGEPRAGYEVRTAEVAVRLFAGTRFEMLEAWHGRSYIGEHYRLTNTGTSAVRFAEQEFYQKSVEAVQIDQHVLMPGDTTDVIIVRRAGQ
jgi:type-F conjugative transfer system secretin TraK